MLLIPGGRLSSGDLSVVSTSFAIGQLVVGSLVFWQGPALSERRAVLLAIHAIIVGMLEVWSASTGWDASSCEELREHFQLPATRMRWAQEARSEYELPGD